MVDLVCNTFKKVIVIINANNPMELDWVDKYDSIGAVLLVPGTGNSAMSALGGILNGSINPSGRTVDTYLKDLTLAPSFHHSGNSGNHLYTNVDDLLKKIGRNDISFQGVISFTDYVEGIYMGYKFYETAAAEGAINYDEYVQYPFGYGLSYTTFEQSIVDFKQDDKSLTVSVKVTNTGDTAGKDVVELYFTPPYTNGGYVLEAGEYSVSICRSAHEAIDSKSFTLSADVIYDGGLKGACPSKHMYFLSLALKMAIRGSFHCIPSLYLPPNSVSIADR